MSRHSSEMALLWLWHRLAATALIQPPPILKYNLAGSLPLWFGPDGYKRAKYYHFKWVLRTLEEGSLPVGLKTHPALCE